MFKVNDVLLYNKCVKAVTLSSERELDVFIPTITVNEKYVFKGRMAKEAIRQLFICKFYDSERRGIAMNKFNFIMSLKGDYGHEDKPTPESVKLWLKYEEE